MMQKTVCSCIALFFVPAALPSAAFSEGLQDEEDAVEGEEDAGEGEVEPAPPAEGGEDEAWIEGEDTSEIAPPAKDTSTSLEEDPARWYYGIGARIRMHVLPAWLYKFKVDGAYTEVGYGVGIDATFRIKGLDIIPSVWFHDVSHGDAKMKEPGDPEHERELVINNMRLIMITADFLNSVRILSWLYFFYGAGVGIGVPVTRIKRWELTSSGDKCTGPQGDPVWCEDGGSYGENDPWPVYPYLNILVGLRFKPIPNFVANFDLGIGTGFIIGTRVSYIF